jgi:hypothetical protein
MSGPEQCRTEGAAERNAERPDASSGRPLSNIGGATRADRLLALQRAIGNRAVGRMLARASAPSAPPKIGPAANIPEDRGDVERGYFSVTDKVTYGVRASGPGKEGGLWVDHLFDTQAEAEAYAKNLAAGGQTAIREASALPHAWPGKGGGPPVPGNPVLNVYVVEVPAGTPYIQGVVREQPESSLAPGMPKSWSGGGPQTVISKGNIIKAVAEFPVAGAVPPAGTAPASPTTGTPAAPVTILPPPTPAEQTSAAAAGFLPGLQKEMSATAAALRALTASEQKAEEARRSKEAEIKRLKAKYGNDPAVWEAQAELVGLADDEKKLAAKRAELQAKLAQAARDLKLVTEPGATTAALNEMLSRRGKDVTVGSTTDESGHGWRFTEKGWVRAATTERSNVAGGAAVTDKSTTTTVVDPLSGVTKTTTQGTTVAAGGQSASKTTTTSQGVSWTGGELAYTTGKATKTTESDEAKAYAKSTTSGESTKIGLGGVIKTRESSEQVGSTVASTKSSSGITRGEGKVGYTAAKTQTFGEVDETGQLVKGTSSTVKQDVGAIIGPEGVGGYGAVSKEVKQQHSKGVYTSGSAGADCKFVVSVKELKDRDPVQYQLVTTIVVGGRLGVGGGAERETESKGSASGGASGSASGSVTVSFVHTLSEAEKNTYLNRINAAAGGASEGSNKEFAILATAARSGPEAARSMINSVRTATGSATGAKEMAEGSSIELGAEGKLEGGLTGGGKTGGGGSVGVEVGGSKTSGIKVRVGKKGGKVVLSVAVSGEDAWKLGASAGYGVASMGYTHESKTGASRSVSFTLDPNDPDYDKQFAEIRAATSIEQLKLLMVKYPKLLGAHAESTTTGSTGTTKVGVGPVTGGITTGAERGETTETDEKGQVTKTYTGSNVGGAELGAFGYKASSQTTEKLELKVDPQGKATGDVTKTTTESDLGKTVTKLPEKLVKDPLGVLSGGTKLAESTTDVQGMKLSDSDIDAIIARAYDKRAWTKPVATPRLLEEWEATRQKIIAAGGDKKQVGKALADFVGTEGHARAAAVEGTVRRPLTGSGGKRYEWPDELASHKAAFDEVVFGDPLSGPRAKARDGKLKDAIDELEASIHKLAQVYGNVVGGAASFKDPSVHAEMVSLINAREAELKAEVRIITNKMTRPVPAKADPGKPAAAPDVAADEAERKRDEEERARIKAEAEANQFSYTLMNNKQQEIRLFNEVDAEYNKKALGFIPVKADIVVVLNKINKIKELHVSWNRQIADYKAICQKYSWSPLLGPDREPNVGKVNEYYSRANTW